MKNLNLLGQPKVKTLRRIETLILQILGLQKHQQSEKVLLGSKVKTQVAVKTYLHQNPIKHVHQLQSQINHVDQMYLNGQSISFLSCHSAAARILGILYFAFFSVILSLTRLFFFVNPSVLLKIVEKNKSG